MPESEYKLDMVSVRLVPDAPILSDHKIITKEDAVAVMKEFLSKWTGSCFVLLICGPMGHQLMDIS